MFIDPHPKFIILTPNLRWEYLGGEAFGRWLGPWAESSEREIVPFTRGSLACLTQENTEGSLQSVIRKSAPAKPGHAGVMTLDF